MLNGRLNDYKVPRHACQLRMHNTTDHISFAFRFALGHAKHSTSVCIHASREKPISLRLIESQVSPDLLTAIWGDSGIGLLLWPTRYVVLRDGRIPPDEAVKLTVSLDGQVL